MSFGCRNWMLLNRNVAMVQKNLHGKLPSRENVTELLQRVVVKSPLNTNTLPSVAGRAVTKALIGGGGVYSYIRVLPDEFLLKSTVMTTDFKRNSSGRTRIYEYAPPPPINALVTALVAGTDRVTEHRMSSQKRLLFDEYGINFPTNKTKRQQTGDSLSTATSTRTSTESFSASSCTSTFFSLSSAHCTQETQDFKLAVKLQQEEIDESPSEQQEHTAVQIVKLTAN